MDHKDLGYRFYYKYEQEKDIDAAITALAAHYSYRELTEDNYEKELAEVFEKDGLWAEKYKKKWKEIVLKCWFFLLFYFFCMTNLAYCM